MKSRLLNQAYGHLRNTGVVPIDIIIGLANEGIDFDTVYKKFNNKQLRRENNVVFKRR